MNEPMGATRTILTIGLSLAVATQLAGCKFCNHYAPATATMEEKERVHELAFDYGYQFYLRLADAVTMRDGKPTPSSISSFIDQDITRSEFARRFPDCCSVEYSYELEREGKGIDQCRYIGVISVSFVLGGRTVGGSKNLSWGSIK